MRGAILYGLFYCSLFIGTGVSMPYMPVWFRAQGLSGAQIGMILAAPALARIVIAPLFAVWADGFERRRTPMILFGLASGLSFGLIGLVNGFAPWLVCWLAGSCFLGTIIPLADVLVLRRSARDGFNYGLPRGIGSAAFVAGNVGMGALLTFADPVIVLVWTACAALLAGVCARLLLPPDPVHESGERLERRGRWAGVSELVRNQPFLLVVAVVSLLQATHAYYYAFSTLLWRDQGVADLTVGLLWATGVTAEIAFMWFCEPWRRRIGPERLVMLGGVAAAIRWTAFAASPPLWLLFPLQILHAFSFAAVFMGGLKLIERTAPPHSASAAQTISSAAGGLAIGLVTLGVGPLFDAFGARGYLSMSLVALVGLGGAAWMARTARAA